MVRSILILVTAISALLLTGAGFQQADAKNDKKLCRGYSVLEVDKGIDCNGDTIKLVKVNGYFERVSAVE